MLEIAVTVDDRETDVFIALIDQMYFCPPPKPEL